MRNRIIVLAIILVNAAGLTAQTNKGKFLLAEMSSINVFGSGTETSMNLGWTTHIVKSDSNEEYNPAKGFSLNFIPRIGYFVIDNLALGLDFTIDYHRTKRESSDFVGKYTQFTTGPFARYYVPLQKLLPYAEINYSIGSGGYSWISGNDEDEYKNQVHLYGFGIGMGFPLGEKVSFDTLLGYQSSIIKPKEDNAGNYRDITRTIGLKLGVTIFL